MLHMLPIMLKKKEETSITVCSPDTDVFILLLKYSEIFGCQMQFQTGTGAKKRNVDINKIGQQLTYLQKGFTRVSCAIRLRCHRRVCKKGKLKFFKAFQAADDQILAFLIDLGNTEIEVEKISNQLEKFICMVYNLKANIMTLAELRWWGFSKQQLESEQLPPTQSSLLPALRRARLQAYIWVNAHKKTQVELEPTEYGWRKEENVFLPVLSDLPNVAPNEILNLILMCLQKK
ncbi:uncharacterized protein LOC126740999 [Anthonomus grandis grandis]|uniref:uncharacterized protein LOC126740999 n=1 Tax=Anthonomus grandis grandis TaxID=2921223 RepID=UPI0021658E9E|nr:uncharacterized protein LOC126740999 [Anthonomus grandis grandis]